MIKDDLFSPETAPKTEMRRILALVFPHLSADFYRRRMKRPDEGPLALYEKVDGALKVAALNAAAEALGLYKGEPLAEARALVPALDAAPLDDAADAADFRRLLDALLRYSPLVGSGGFGTAFLDIGAAAHLFGGETRLAADASFRLQNIGLDARAAVAATPGCAWAMASAQQRAEPGSRKMIEAGALAALPVAALRIEPGTIDALKSLGLKTIGALMARSRKELTKRFGNLLLQRLDQATGALFEPITPIAPPPDFSADAVLAEPVFTIEAALLVAERLAASLAGKLETAGLGAHLFGFTLFRLDMSYEKIAIILGRPARAPETVLRLLRLKLERGAHPVDPGFGFESFRLAAFRTAPLGVRQTAAFAEQRADITALKDRLVNHLGSDVFHLAPVARHIPERAERRTLALAPSLPWPEATGERPLSLLDPPEPILATASLPDGPPASFRWRGQARRAARAAGPERILGEWRRGENFLRDYYRIEDEEGRRYWVFREGFYEDGAKWFLHGFFA